MKPFIILAITLFLLPSLQAVDFVHEVMPILKEHCAECHTGNKKKGGLAINTRAELLAGGENGAVAVSGDSAKSHMIMLITSNDDSEWMPPKGPRLPPEKIAILKKWIDADLPWDPGITLAKSAWEPPLKPRSVALPPALKGREHPIDRILDADLAKRGQPLPAPTSDAALLRRVTLDTIGLLPTPEDLNQYLHDLDSGKFTKKIDTLLSNDIAYADHWLTTWNDLLRNDYTGTGFITQGRTQITTWLYQALRENKPYDQFVRELIAPPDKESAGFINGIKWRGDVNASQTTDIQFAQNISQVFLGINMKCASCHDSFIDRWKLAEAYNLAAIFAEQPLELNRCDKPIGVMATPKWIFPELGDVDAKLPKTERLQQLASLMTHPENGRFTRTVVNRIWERLMGRGIVHPVDAMDTRPWNEDLLDYLAVHFAEDGYDLRKLIRFVMSSHAYQSKTVILAKEPGEDYAYSGPIARRMSAEQFIDTIWQITGTNPTKAEAQANRIIAPSQDALPEPTLKPAVINAQWIWHEGEVGKKTQIRKTIDLQGEPKTILMLATCDNAFVMKINGANVAESKDWQKPVYRDVTQHFKKGANSIVVDAEMFGGANGFICQFSILEQGGAQREVATSKDWEARPPGGTWALSREISPHGGGPWGKILDPEAPILSQGTIPPVRAALVQNDFLMRSLGRPHRDQVVTTRPGGLTTLQAIDLANGDILANYLKTGAQNLTNRSLDKDLGQWLYLYAFSRPLTAPEQSILNEVATGDLPNSVQVEDLLWLVFMQPEFQIIR